MPNITILNGEETGKSYEWTSDRIRIGRNAANDFVIANASVSGEHCLIERCDGGWRVKDLDSTNGTRLNDRRITLADLHRNDLVSFGDISVSFRGDDVPEAEPSATVSSTDDIPRTTIVMRPTVKPKLNAAEGFGKRSEGNKKALNAIIAVSVVIILALAAVLAVKLFAA